MSESWRVADAELRRIAGERARLDGEELRWLREAERLAVHREYGFGSFLEYGERVLGYRPRTVIERLRVAEALEGLPGLRAALAANELSYSAVREISRVAVAATEGEWIEAVRGKTVREVETMVAGRGVGDRPSDPADASLELRRVVMDLEPEVMAMLLEAKRVLADRCGRQLDDSEMVAAMCEAVLGEGEGAGASSKAPVQLVVRTCEECARTTLDGGGHVIDVPAVVAEQARCDARITVDGAPPVDAVPRAVRKAVLVRDHGRCVVPGCRAARHLHVHHLVERAHGGAHGLDNLITICGGHHRAIHGDRLRVSGAVGALTWAHRDGRPYGS